MADKLIIVESPAKANTIKKFLGGNTKVVASMGHIRDLPKSKLAVNIENNFEPEYINIRGKGDLIKTLKKEYKSPQIKIEKQELKSLSKDECKIDRMLELFKENEVTPISAGEIIEDFFGKRLAKTAKVV